MSDMCLLCHMYEVGLKLLKAFQSYAETINTNFYIILHCLICAYRVMCMKLG